MERTSFSARRRQAGLWVSSFMLIAAAACSDSEPVVGPLLPPAPPENPEIVSAAWIADINKIEGTVKITPPARGYDPQIIADFFGLAPDHPEFSILAGDVVDVLADPASLNFSPVGQFSPGLIRVTFDVAIRNKLSAVDLIQPTFPTPPPSTSGALLFPFETIVTTTTGGVTGGQGDGTGVIVELPNQGNVAPSVDFDGAPFNFFNDSACGPTDNDCYRYEEFGVPVVGGSTTAFQTIGFDAEATVSQFRARMIVAADLLDSTPNALPVASAGGPYTGDAGQPIAFDGTGSNDPDGTIVQYDWDFGDGSTGSGATPSHVYATAGSYTATLTVTDNRGGTATASSAVTVNVPANIPPVASYTFSCTGTTCAFDGTGSTDADGTIASYAWDFGDGNTGSGATVSHSYAGPGTYTVTLTVTDNGGAIGTQSQTVTVAAAANAIGVWVNASGNVITSASVGSTATLQLCTTESTLQAFQASVNYNGALAGAAAGADLNTVSAGAGACANVGGSDVVDQYTGAAGNPVNFLNFSIAAAPGSGPVGLAAIPFNLTAAGSLQPTITIDVATDFGGSNLSLTFNIPALTIN
ncbi:MAG: PKD domain-containing protein [Gemmatimonadota bacterium]